MRIFSIAILSSDFPFLPLLMQEHRPSAASTTLTTITDFVVDDDDEEQEQEEGGTTIDEKQTNGGETKSDAEMKDAPPSSISQQQQQQPPPIPVDSEVNPEQIFAGKVFCFALGKARDLEAMKKAVIRRGGGFQQFFNHLHSTRTSCYKLIESILTGMCMCLFVFSV